MPSSARSSGSKDRARGARGAGRPAAAGPRSPSPGEEQPSGRRLAAQHPRAQRGTAGSQGRLFGDRPAGRRACRSSTAIIMPRWRKIAASRCGPLLTELAADLRSSAPVERARHADRPRSGRAVDDPGRRGGGRLPDHRDRRICDAPPGRTTRSKSRSGGQRADRDAGDFFERPGPRRRQADDVAKNSSSGSSKGWPASCARRSTASSAATAVTLPIFPDR